MNREERNFNEALQLETEAAMRAARVVAKARREALEAGKTQTDTKVFLEAINATLNGMDKKLIKALRAEGILEKGYRQGKAQVRGLREGGFTGFEPMIDPYMLAQETSKAVDTMKGVEAYAKEIIKETIEIGLARGEGAGDLLRRLVDPAKGAFKMTQRKAEMRARTISNDLVNAGKQASYRAFRDAFPDLGINNQWYNISDSRSSDVCKGLNGEIRPIGSPFSSGHMRPPAHPFCRSTILPTLEKPSGSLDQPQEVPLEPEKPKESPKVPKESPKVPKKPKESPKAPEKPKAPKESLKAPGVDISKIFYEGELLGAGAFGRVYALDGIAIKLGEVSEREFGIHRDLGERGIAAKVLSELSTFEDEPVYAMEELKGFKPVRGNMGPYVLNQAAIVMHKAGYVHEDLHGGNVLMNPETGEFKVLDFGLTEKTSDYTRMVQEYIQTPNRNPSKADKKIRELIKEGDSLDIRDSPEAARAKWKEAGERYKEFLETQPDTRIVPEEIRAEAIFIPLDPQGNPKKKAGIFGKPLESDSMGLKEALADFEGSPESLGNFDDLVGDLADILGVAEEPPKKPPEELKKPKKPKKPPEEPRKTPEPLEPREPPREPVDLARIVEEGARLGGGVFGQVFALGGVAVKKGAISSDEPRIQRILADAGLSPKVLSEIGEVNGERAYAMEALDSGFQPASRLPDAELAPVMIGILMKVHGQGVVHWDFHSGNVMYNKATGVTQVIDFGMSKSDSVPTRLFQEFASTALRLDRWHGATPEMFPKDIADIFKKALKIQALLDEGKFEEVKKLELKAAKAYWKIIDPDRAPGKKPK
jgi:SPP1 gp7 family putative phage head morphogenesis protein